MDNPEQPVKQTPPVAPSQPTTSSYYGGKRNWIKLGLIYLAVALVLYGGIYYFVLSKKGSNPYSSNYNYNQTPTAYQSSPTPTTDPTANWKTYANTQYSFSLKYPADWYVKTVNDHPNALLDLAFYDTTDTGMWGGLFNGLHIEIYDYNQGLTLSDYVNQQVIKPYVSYKKSVDPAYSENQIKTDMLTIDGIPAVKVSGIWGASNLSGELAKMVTPSERGPYVFALKNGKLLVWHWQGNPDGNQFSQDLQIFSTILSTFKFTQ